MTSSPTSTRHSAPPRAAEGLRVSEELPPPVPALFPARGPRERLDDHLTRELALAGERIARGSVMPTLDMARFRRELAGFDLDRKSTRLNSRHTVISYSVFCLKKKRNYVRREYRLRA